eukprot:TRINITY_DN75153_c0_g1_i1.p1 TRINITY_DN75153_c0_g1~~TRINITY_DN75153_c0_g1_i1.p1  ORF type:complete len:190 (+),score=21.57 TRINITY_DN75153_c0_g1_i1:187-756(+)
MAKNGAITSLLVLAFLGLANAHSQPVNSEEGCTCEPGAKPFDSYHIHVIFYPDGIEQFSNNTHNSRFARALRKAFIERFDVPQCPEGNIFNLTTLCAFAVDETGAGGVANAAPFVAPNFAIFVPASRYADAVPWMMANRGDLDFLVHPNTCGFKCGPQDHLLWSVWGGNKWPVRFELPTTERMTSAVMV